MGLASTLSVSFVIRSAKWVLALDLAIAVVIASVATSQAATWRSMLLSGPRLIRNVPGGIGLAVGPLLPEPERLGRWPIGPILRTLILAGLLVAVFGTLFVSADPAFASLAGMSSSRASTCP